MIHIWTRLFGFGFMVFNVTFDNISVWSWRSVWLVEETGVLWEYHRPVACHWQTLLFEIEKHTHVGIFTVLTLTGITVHGWTFRLTQAHITGITVHGWTCRLIQAHLTGITVRGWTFRLTQAHITGITVHGWTFRLTQAHITGITVHGRTSRLTQAHITGITVHGRTSRLTRAHYDFKPNWFLLLLVISKDSFYI
jgi:hypothetical protein